MDKVKRKKAATTLARQSHCERKIVAIFPLLLVLMLLSIAAAAVAVDFSAHTNSLSHRC